MLLDLAEEADDAATLAEVEAELPAIHEKLADLEFKLVLAGPYDRKNAILAVHAGTGGTEAQDWAEMMLRMYVRWAERNGYKTEVLDRSEGEEAGVVHAVGAKAPQHAQRELQVPVHHRIGEGERIELARPGRDPRRRDTSAPASWRNHGSRNESGHLGARRRSSRGCPARIPARVGEPGGANEGRPRGARARPPRRRGGARATRAALFAARPPARPA